MPTRFLYVEQFEPGLEEVGYRLLNGVTLTYGARVAPIAAFPALDNLPAFYGALVTLAADFTGGVLWDDGNADPELITYAFVELNEAAAGDAPTAVEIRQELDSNSTQLAKLGAPAATLAADLAAVAVQAAAIKLITDRINGALELDGAVYRLTANALELAPGGTLYGDSGLIEWTYIVYDTDGVTPLPGAEVWVSSDLAGTLRSASRISDSLGRAVFSLNAGTVYVWRQHAYRGFGNPDTESVS